MSDKRQKVIARLTKGKLRFEIIVDAEKAWQYRSGKKLNIREIVEGEIIYSDARKGFKASEENIRKVFGTLDFYKVAERILKEGELQLTAEQRRELIEAKRRQIIEYIARNCVDARTGLPIPPKRIELALQQVRVGIDPFKPVEVQVTDVLKELRKVLPLKMEKVIVGLKIPPQYIGKVQGYVMRLGKLIRSEYQSDGSWIAEIEIPAGLQSTLIDKVASLTRGSGEVKIVSRSGGR
ncbi:MAG: ribosome assembly factor SBDS [Thermoprotei archaeon]|nr:MAG: ribosome assembly factor SBDS [Thermoprotei archaeon]RLF01062.1 MAG: ribosome assembly factor SBDS [Thermoprotei archaeon]